MVYEARGGSGFEFQMENSVLEDSFGTRAWGYHFYALDALVYQQRWLIKMASTFIPAVQKDVRCSTALYDT